MKIFAIRDDLDATSKDIAYLIYYERDKRFYIELPKDADPWETPLLLPSSSAAKRRSTRTGARLGYSSASFHPTGRTSGKY